jgi:hypothetical protein
LLKNDRATPPLRQSGDRKREETQWHGAGQRKLQDTPAAADRRALADPGALRWLRPWLDRAADKGYIVMQTVIPNIIEE